MLIGWGNWTSDFDASHPRPNHIAYELNADTGEARWVSVDYKLDDWTSQFFPETPTRGTFELDGGLDVSAFVAVAPVAAIGSSTIAILGDTTTNRSRQLTFRLTPPGGAARLDAKINGIGEITAATIEGYSLE